MGHLEGITFLDTRGDGRYFISNGKDQTIKLWDIRRMSTNAVWYVSFLLPWLLLESAFCTTIHEKSTIKKVFVMKGNLSLFLFFNFHQQRRA